MNRVYSALLAVGLAFGLSGCYSTDTGAVVGGVAGGAVAHQISGGSGVATVAGTLTGAYLGREASRPRADYDYDY